MSKIAIAFTILSICGAQTLCAAPEENTEIQENICAAPTESTETQKNMGEDPNATFCHTNMGAGIAAEFLWWSTNYNFPYTVSANSSKGPTVVIDPNITKTVTQVGGNVVHTDHSWSPGVRVALSFFPDYDKMDLGLLWTYYHNKSTGAHSASIDTKMLILGNFNMSQAALSLSYNVADFELGKSYFLNSKVLFRPFASVRAIWLSENHRLKFDGVATENIEDRTISVETPAQLNLKQKVWAVGPRAGVNTSWFRWYGLSIMANASASLLYGKINQGIIFDVTSENLNGDIVEIKQVTGRVKGDYAQLFPTVQMVIGASWEHCFTQDTSLKIYAGWEANFLWETQNILFFDRPISMQGLTTGLGVNF